MITHLMTSLRIAMHLSSVLAARYNERRAQPNIRTTHYSVWFAAACLASCFLIALVADPAWAATSAPVNGQTATFTLFDTLEQDAETQSNSWFATILGLVRPTFLILATIEICWAAAIWAFEKDNLNSLAVEIIKKIMFIGFFFSLLQFAPEWIPTIAETFVEVGEQATGTEALTTDGIIATGLAVIKAIWAEAPTGFFNVLGKLGQILVACFVTIGVVIAYVVIAAQYFTLKIESYILFAAGAIFLGLGSSSWTKEYVSKYLNYAINVGVRLLVMILILSLMIGAVSRMSDGFAFDYEPLLKLLAVAILQAILGVRAPEMAGALLNGGVGLSAGTASGAGSSVMSAGGAIAGLAASAVQGASNFSKAASAGRDMAKQQGKSGGAATLSGLGSAAAAVGRAVPGKMMDAVKRATKGGGGGGGGRGQKPGVFDMAKQDLQKRASGDGGGKAGGGASGLASLGGGSSGSSNSAPRGGSSSASPGGGSSGSSGSSNVTSPGSSSSGSSDSASLGSGPSSSSNTLGSASSTDSGSSDSSSASSAPDFSSSSNGQGDTDSSDSPSSSSASSPSLSSLGSSSPSFSSPASTSSGAASPRSGDGPRQPNKLRKAAPRPSDSKHSPPPRNKDI